jgi:hypothetical protein
MHAGLGNMHAGPCTQQQQQRQQQPVAAMHAGWHAAAVYRSTAQVNAHTSLLNLVEVHCMYTAVY